MKQKENQEFIDGTPDDSMKFDQVFEGDEVKITPPNQDMPLPEAGDVSTELAKQKQDNAELADKYLRVQAEYQNYRKRVAKDMGAVRAMAVTDTVMPFLELFDNFSMAVKAAQSGQNLKAIITGLEMIDGQYLKALDALNVARFDAVNAKFDPNLHDAVANEASETVPEGTVIRQWCCGYRLGEQILRPARVVVSSGPAKKEQ